MKYSWLISLILVLLVAAPMQAISAGGEPANVELIDVPNDGGGAVAVLWNWIEPPADGARLVFEIRIPQALIDKYALTEREQSRLDSARQELEQALAPLLTALSTASAATAEAQTKFQVAEANRRPETATLRRDYYRLKSAEEAIANRINRAKERFTSRVKAGRTTLLEKSRIHEYLLATSENAGWLATNGIMPAGGPSTMGDEPRRFGHNPADPEKLYVELNSLKPAHPAVFAGNFDAVKAAEIASIDETLNDVVSVNLEPGMDYEVRLQLVEGLGPEVELKPIDMYSADAMAGIGGLTAATFDLGSTAAAVNYFDGSKLNNLVFATVFAAIILAGIMVARRNPHIFIRRIQGLEAVDEAIGRATEMGKPVLYLCGLDPLSTLPTIAAVNILGRVARRIADYDSDLVVPCRDPVVLTVAQEVAKEAYIDAGRPDAYREDNIYFVTDDQFSYTATTCAIMMREKPAANFFMGYYYAESLLLAETGAATGAIQIAGTDALHQLPFFITTCDYTLIGEELYAASAYLSREPMLLGSLKGQDISKAVFMVIIVVQTILFIFNGDWNWLRMLVEPL